MTDTLLAITDRACDAQSALWAIKSHAYGGIVGADEAKRCAAELRKQAEEIEALLSQASGQA